MQRKKEEYQKDLERLRDAQRKLERDREALQRQINKMEDVRVTEVSRDGNVRGTLLLSLVLLLLILLSVELSSHSRLIEALQNKTLMCIPSIMITTMHVYYFHLLFSCRGLPLRPQMTPSSPAAPSLWTWTRWTSPHHPPPPCRGSSRSSLSPKGRVSILLPCLLPTHILKAVNPTAKSQRACCSWPSTRIRMGRRKRRAKEGACRQQVENIPFS